MNIGTSPFTAIPQAKVTRDRSAIRASSRLRLFWKRSSSPKGKKVTVLSPDTQTIASCQGDRTVKLWNAATGKRIKTLIHQQPIWTCDFSPAGWGIASAGEDGFIWLWDLESGRCFSRLQGHTDCIHSLDFSPVEDIVASGSADTTVRLWNVATGKCLSVFEGHDRPVCRVAFDPSGEFLATQSDDHLIKIWEIRTGKCLDTLTAYLDGSSDLWVLIEAIDLGC